jgi:DNA repair protein RadC
MTQGPESLSLSELLAILIGSGTRGRSALSIARELTNGSLNEEQLARVRDVHELTGVAGLGPARAAVIVAALEVGRRLSGAHQKRGTVVRSPEDAARVIMDRLRYEMQEHFLTMLLSSKGKVMAIKEISRGSLNATVAHPREVFAPALVHHAAAILVIHNHPSGDPTPSREDEKLTRKLEATGRVMDIPLLDHVVIGDGIYYSFKEHGLL